MEVIVKKGEKQWNGKLDGEFRSPLDFGTGSKKNKGLCCKNCKTPKYLSANTVGFICEHCKTYNGSDDMALCKKLYEECDHEGSDTPHILTEDMKRHVNFRDTQAIKADLYRRGIRRNTVGGDRFRKILKRTLQENHVR